MRLSSRETPAREDTLADLTREELELVAALLYNCKMGRGVSPWRDAVFTLSVKLNELGTERYGTADFAAQAAGLVDPRVVVLDAHGSVVVRIGSSDFELEV